MEILDGGSKISWTEEIYDTPSYVHVKMESIPSADSEQNFIMKDRTFPKEVPDWSNLKVIHRNTLPPRSSFVIYDNATDALTRDFTKSKWLSLSGTWRFHLAKSPFEAPPGFFESAFDTGTWADIKVPGMWQLQSHGKGPQYVAASEYGCLD